MPVAYFDFHGKPAKLILDEDELPESCEIYDPAAGAFVLRDDLTLDVMNGYGSCLISEDAFQDLLNKVCHESGQAR